MNPKALLAEAVTPAATAPFLVETPTFTGTLGELAHALRSEKLAPGALDVSELVARYLEVYRTLAEHDLGRATETLPLLARIIELKVRLLLPQPPKAPEAELEEVLETVLALEAFEDAIGFLRERREWRRHLVSAQTPRPTYPRRPRPLMTKLSRLAELATRHRAPHYFELAAPRLTLASALQKLRAGLKQLQRGTLETLMEAKDWPTLTVAFGAMLEMVKEREAEAEQTAPYEEIVLSTVETPPRAQ